MINRKTVMEVARIRVKEQELRSQLDAIKNQLKMKEGGFFCCSYGFDNGIGLELPIADFLALFPAVEPVLKTYVSTLDGKTHAWHEWPFQNLGELKPGFYVWVKAETKAHVVKTLEEKVNAEPAVAAAA